MPYLPVDLDGKRLAVEIANALGINHRIVVGGLVDLWEAVWRAHSAGKADPDIVDGLTLAACFGLDETLRGALVSRGFLAEAGNNWRVCGAAKWLFGLEGKRRGGHAAKSNLIPGGPKRAQVSRAPEGKPLRSAETQAETYAETPAESEPVGRTSALSPSTQHPKEEKPMSASADAVAVFEHWAAVFTKNGGTKFKGKRRRNVENRLKDGFTVEQLCRAVDGCRLSPFHMGQNDRSEVYNDLELICRDAAQVEKFIGYVDRPPRIPQHRGAAPESAKDWSRITVQTNEIGDVVL